MGNAGVLGAALIVGSLAVTAGGYALMLAFRQDVRIQKPKRGWTADAQESVAVVGEAARAAIHPLKWNLLYRLPIMAITFAVGAVGYVHMPDTDSHAYGLRRHRERWAEKPRSSCGCRYSSGFMAACFVFSHWTIARSKKWAEPARRPNVGAGLTCSPARRASIWWQEAW